MLSLLMHELEIETFVLFENHSYGIIDVMILMVKSIDVMNSKNDVMTLWNLSALYLLFRNQHYEIYLRRYDLGYEIYRRYELEANINSSSVMMHVVFSNRRYEFFDVMILMMKSVDVIKLKLKLWNLSSQYAFWFWGTDVMQLLTLWCWWWNLSTLWSWWWNLPTLWTWNQHYEFEFCVFFVFFSVIIGVEFFETNVINSLMLWSWIC